MNKAVYKGKTKILKKIAKQLGIKVVKWKLKKMKAKHYKGLPYNIE